MNVRTAVVFGLLAVLATVLAVAAGADVALAIPAAAAAVVFAAVLLVEMLEVTRWSPGRPVPTFSTDPSRVRSSFVAGIHGRPALVATLDGLDRASGSTSRPVTSVAEMQRIRSMSREEFRSYLDQRVTELEART